MPVWVYFVIAVLTSVVGQYIWHKYAPSGIREPSAEDGPCHRVDREVRAAAGRALVLQLSVLPFIIGGAGVGFRLFYPVLATALFGDMRLPLRGLQGPAFGALVLLFITVGAAVGGYLWMFAIRPFLSPTEIHDWLETGIHVPVLDYLADRVFALEDRIITRLRCTPR
jgi:hypothetical protein